uniref:DH domain-containing protein n=1 Tax=Caenorhabditis tropicalis TaxID=1561998 RepID=A0A1I7UTT2_9PELO
MSSSSQEVNWGRQRERRPPSQRDHSPGKGPEGGFQVKLSDSDDLSEDELEDDDTKSQSCISEIDTDSEITGGSTSTKSGLDKRYQKAWYAAKELVDSEQRYVEKLRLLGDVS